MSKRKKLIEEFFNAYELHFNSAMSDDRADVTEEITRSFADYFVESSPLGVICGKNDAGFVEKIKQGFVFYKSIGSVGMNIISKEITLLDDFHAVVKVYWRYSYLKDNNPGIIDFNSFYFVSTLNGETKIFAYIAGDEQKELKERGLIPHEESVVN